MSDNRVELSSAFAVLPTIHFGGRRQFDPCWAEKPHATDCCELLHVTRGKVGLELGGAIYQAVPGDLLFVPAKTLHRDLFDFDQGLEAFMVFFSWEAEEEFFRQVTNDALRSTNPVLKAGMVRQCEELRRDDSDDMMVARSRLLTLLLTALRAAIGDTDPAAKRDDDRTKRRRTLMLQARRYLNQHFTSPVSLDDIARELDVSAYYLSHVFSEENDFSLFTYLTGLRMERARELLQNGQYNVSEVSRAVGYENANYFAKVFRKHFGRPPGDYL